MTNYSFILVLNFARNTLYPTFSNVYPQMTYTLPGVNNVCPEIKTNLCLPNSVSN